LLGTKLKVTERRGEMMASTLAPFIAATVHPSSILRAPDEEARQEAMTAFVNDMRTIADVLRQKGLLRAA
jgi:uracil-DNA glycosylase